MKALILEGINEKLICKETEMPVLQSGEVLVKVAAAAVNHRDLWIQKGQYAGLKFPIILGSDGCGTVEAVADEVHADWIGKEVVINPSMNWG
ncbi:MAG: alcohol dehydrogenase catalytic domain-containing protein, partial [Bacteroidia bacterium]|nr:alcohol dehydrogenase catalytic domain-containing protein [Bacteroidia bacterium]